MKVLFVTNMYPTQSNPKAGTFIEQQITSLIDAGIEHKVLLIDRANKGISQYLKTFTAVKRACREFQPDLVHVMYGGILAAASTLAARGFPRVVSFCGVDLLGADYGTLKYRLRTRLGVLASHFASKRCEAIIVKSQNLKDGLKPEIDEKRVTIVPNGVSMDRFKPMERLECRKKLNWDLDKFIVLFSTTSRSNAKKRLWLAEEVLDRVKQKGHPEVELKGLHKVAHDQVSIWINASDMTLLTSMKDEGSPNIIKETLCCDNPVVSLAVGDVAERIAGVDGCYLCQENTDELADAIIKVINGKREVDGQSAMKTLSLEAVAQRILKLYGEII